MAFTMHENLSSPSHGGVSDKHFIVIHHFGAPGQTSNAYGTALYLSGRQDASVNFVAGEGEAWCLVSPGNIAWAQGDGANGNGNRHGISIENHPIPTERSLNTLAELIIWIRERFGNLPLRIHKEFTATACPGVYAGMLNDIEARVARIKGGSAPAPAPAPKPVAPAPAPVAAGYVPDTHWHVDKDDTLTDVARYFGSTVDAVAKFNAIADVNVIEVGERIWPPNKGYADTWEVEKGDTLSGVSQWYATQGHRVSVEQLKNANGINNPNTEVKVGMRLVIP